MDWDTDSIRLFLDDQLLNSVSLTETVNPDGFNPFLQPHYLLLNLALGANGGDPATSSFPVRYEVDWVRVYQKK
jgi:beta-glucanase (GH16 family)